jgi:hypothetical protein
MTAARRDRVGRGKRAVLYVVVGAIAPGLSACSDTRPLSIRSAGVDSTSGEVTFRWAGPGGAAITVPAHINKGSES